MSFIGAAKHTLSIGVRVMSDDAVAGFRKAASASQELIAGQRAGIRAIEAELRNLRSKEEVAQRAMVDRSKQASRDLEDQKAKYSALTREIEDHRRALDAIKSAAPRGDAAFSQQYRNAIAYNKTIDEQVAKEREIGKVRAANAKLEVENIRKLAASESKQAEINKTLTEMSLDRAKLKALKQADAKSAGVVPAELKSALGSYETKAKGLVTTRSLMAEARLDIKELQDRASAGRIGASLLSRGVLKAEDNTRLYDKIRAQAKSGQITAEEAKSQYKSLALQGIFPSTEIAKGFEVKAQAAMLPIQEDLRKLAVSAKQQSDELYAAKERIKAAPNITQEAKARLAERLAVTDRLVESGTKLAEIRGAERGNMAAARGMAAEVQRKETIAAAEQTKKIAEIIASKQVVPEKGMSDAAKANKAAADAATEALKRKNLERAANEAEQTNIRRRRDEDLVSLRAKRDAAAKDSETKREALDAARKARDANIQQAAAARDAARALRQQLIGAITESVAKIAMTLQFIKTVMAATRSAENFEFSARSVSALLGERRGAGEALYNQYFAKYGKIQSEVMPTAAVERMKQLAAAGYTKSGMVENTAAIFDVMLASAGELTEQSAADLGISLERAFGSLRMDMRTALDTAVKAANQFPMTVGNIRDALGYATEAAVQSGQSLEETLLVIGSIMPIAKTASKAGTITRNALLSLVKPESQQVLSELGVRPVDAEGKRRPMMDVFLDLNDQLNEVAKGKASKYYQSPEFIAAEKARAKAEGRKYEPRSLDKVFKNQLGLEREQLEFKLTGVRGGAIFAAINRMVQTTAEKMKGTAFEGMRAADARTAFEFLRIGLSGAAGEAARLAGELRRTSKMLGESFDASLERFKIALGSAALPLKDAFLSVSKQILDYFTEALTPAPGVGKEYTPGGSTLINAGATLAGIGVGGVLAKQALGFGKAIFDAKALVGLMRTKAVADAAAAAAAAAAATGGATAGAAAAGAAATGTATLGAVGMLGAAFRGIVAFLGGPWGLAIMAATAGLVALKTGTEAAYKAVTDFSDYLDRQNKSRMQREDKALGAMFEAMASGKLKFDEKTGTVSGLDRGQLLDIAAAGPLAGTLVRGLAKGEIDPRKAGEMLLQGREAMIREQYRGMPELDAKIAEFEQEKKRYQEELMPELMRTLLTSENYKGVGKEQGTFTREQLLAAYSAQLMAEARYSVKYAKEFPTGGAEVDLRRTFIKEQNAKTMQEALDKAGFFDTHDFYKKLALVPPNQRLKITDPAELNRARINAAGINLYRNTAGSDLPDRERLFKLHFFTPEMMDKVLQFEADQAKAPEPFTSLDQLDANGAYRAAITPSSFFSPVMEEFVKTVGEGQQSLTRIPEFATKITDFLSKAATNEGQAQLAEILRGLKLQPESGGSPTMTLSGSTSGN